MKISKRYIDEMAELYDLPKELYTMYRGVKKKGKMRYDITIIPPFIINGHYNKTHGHIHSSGHDEEYIVLEGKAIFLFWTKKGGLWHVEAKKGDHVEIAGNAYHCTINPGKKTLELGNWVHEDCVSDYEYIKRRKGFPMYFTTKGWVKNPNFK